MGALEGKVAVVTGAARGIGLAIATRFVAEGARVLLTDIDGAGVEKAAAELGQRAACVDASRRADVDRMIATANAEQGPVDVLVNNAGIYRNTPLLELTEREFDDVLAVNLKSTLFGIQAVAPQMIARRKGSIVNVASLAAVLAGPGMAAYCTSKAGVVQLTNVAAIELARYNVRVNALAPGTIATDMVSGAYADKAMRDKILPRTPLRRMGRPEEAAGAVLFLASDDSSYVTGKTLFADGGRLGLNLTL